MTDAERRFTTVRVEVRAASDKRTVGGYAAVFESPSQNLGGFREQIAPGAFNRAASKGWPGFDGTGVLALFNHDSNMVLGRSTAGTLRLDIDAQGVRYDVDVPQSREDVYEAIQRGDVAKSSFAFITEPDGDEWSTDDTGFPIRTLTQVRLGDVSAVTSPAYLDSSVGLRSLAKHFDAPIEDVKKLSEANELRKFFVRTDIAPAPKPVDPTQKMRELIAQRGTRS